MGDSHEGHERLLHIERGGGDVDEHQRLGIAPQTVLQQHRQFAVPKTQTH